MFSPAEQNGSQRAEACGATPRETAGIAFTQDATGRLQAGGTEPAGSVPGPADTGAPWGGHSPSSDAGEAW